MFGLLLALIYILFISLGLPDSLLGSGWPIMHEYFNVPVSYAGFVSMSICIMTVISALLSARLVKLLTTKYVVVISVLLSVIGLFGFSISTKFYMLFIFAVPYGLGAGSIDAALNNYVAKNYSSRVMNFLHCFYGLGAVLSPNIMGLALKYSHWQMGYRSISYIQIAILVLAIIGLPLWKINNKETVEETKQNVVSIKDALKIPGVIFALIAFFAYCSGETISFLWSSTFFDTTKEGLTKDIVASLGSLVFLGLMLGRLVSGIVSSKLNDKKLIRIGVSIETVGIILLFIPVKSPILAIIGFILLGFGMGPIYPSIQHLAPINFGKEASGTIIGLQMASAYIGSCFMPFLFGLFQSITSMWMLPVFLLVFMILNISMIEISYKKSKNI